MKKNIILVALSTFLLLGFTGCSSGSQKMQSYAFQPDTITEIQVNTGVAPVALVKSSGNSIEIGFTQEITTVENGVLKVNTPEQKGAIHMKEPATITIKIPSTYQLPIQIASECGDVNVSDVDVSKLTITSETGSVTLSGLEGHIKAQSDVEEIKTGESLASEIKKEDTIGQSLDTNIGNATNEILVHTNASCININ